MTTGTLDSGKLLEMSQQELDDLFRSVDDPGPIPAGEANGTVIFAHGEEVSETAKVFRRENTYGSFSRSIRLSPQLNQEAVEASFKNGFVTITIPKVEEEKPKSLRIPISTNN